MTPIVLLILVGMWAAVLLPPYLRDRNDTRAAGEPRARCPTSSTPCPAPSATATAPGYLPVTSSSLGSPQQAGSPLPAGSRHPLTRRGAPQLVPSAPEPQSSAFSIIGRPERRPRGRGRAPSRTPASCSPPRSTSAAVASRPPPAAHPHRGPGLPGRPQAPPRGASTPCSPPAASACSWPSAWAARSLALHLLIDVALVAYVGLLDPPAEGQGRARDQGRLPAPRRRGRRSLRAAGPGRRLPPGQRRAGPGRDRVDRLPGRPLPGQLIS